MYKKLFLVLFICYGISSSFDDNDDPKGRLVNWLSDTSMFICELEDYKASYYEDIIDNMYISFEQKISNLDSYINSIFSLRHNMITAENPISNKANILANVKNAYDEITYIRCFIDKCNNLYAVVKSVFDESDMSCDWVSCDLKIENHRDVSNYSKVCYDIYKSLDVFSEDNFLNLDVMLEKNTLKKKRDDLIDNLKNSLKECNYIYFAMIRNEKLTDKSFACHDGKMTEFNVLLSKEAFNIPYYVKKIHKVMDLYINFFDVIKSEIESNIYCN